MAKQCLASGMLWPVKEIALLLETGKGEEEIRQASCVEISGCYETITRRGRLTLASITGVPPTIFQLRESGDSPREVQVGTDIEVCSYPPLADRLPGPATGSRIWHGTGDDSNRALPTLLGC